MATQSKTLTTSFQLVGAGPMLITLEVGSRAELHIAASTPAADAPIHSLHASSPTVPDRSSWNYTGSDNVYAKKADPTGTNTAKISFTT